MQFPSVKYDMSVYIRIILQAGLTTHLHAAGADGEHLPLALTFLGEWNVGSYS
jgi:hypothetical protein